MFETPRCPIRGHNHELSVHEELTQKGTGKKAVIWECPTGYYRWFQMEDRDFTDETRMKQPRFGWKD
jgi:hypothetical protein